ncbi:MAG: AraC family transcriptional regulator [Chitinophagales bacterium]|nr:AraC family transcriptional regulator [Chitinophagales bacterium]
MKLFIKNMVCDRCKMVVKAQLEDLNLHPLSVDLGIIELQENELSHEQLSAAKQRLENVGFELLEDRKGQIIEAIKTTVINMVRQSNDEIKLKLSEHIAGQLNYDYHYLSGLFSESESITIEQFAIQQRIERVKELLTYDELTLSEIAYKLGYSSVAALSGQFKKVMKVTPSDWKAGNTARKPLDKVATTEDRRNTKIL